MKKITSIILCLSLLLLSACSASNVDAMSSAKYTKQTIDQSVKYGNAKGEVYYQRIQLKGENKASNKINKAIQKDCNKLLKSRLAREIKEFTKNYPKEKNTYHWRAKSSVKYNKKSVISIRVQTEWWEGGVSNTDRYGLNYSLKTGKKLHVNEVCKKSKKRIKKILYKSIKNRVKKQQEDERALKEIKKKKVKKLNFYIKKNGNVIVTFGPYEIGAGGWYREYKVGKIR